MHECEPYGELRVNGKPMSTEQLARLIGMAPSECKRALAEIEDAGVSSRTADGALYSRRMVRDEATRNARAVGGEAGAEHGIKGAEHGSKGGRPRKATGGNKPPLNPPPSSSSSSSASTVPFPKKERGESAAHANEHPAVLDPWKAVYDRGREVLGRDAGGVITNLKKLYDNKPHKVLAKIEDAAQVREPLKWIMAFLWKVDDQGKLSGEYIGGVPP